MWRRELLNHLLTGWLAHRGKVPALLELAGEWRERERGGRQGKGSGRHDWWDSLAVPPLRDVDTQPRRQRAQRHQHARLRHQGNHLGQHCRHRGSFQQVSGRGLFTSRELGSKVGIFDYPGGQAPVVRATELEMSLATDANISRLQQMFPTVEGDVIAILLNDCGNNGTLISPPLSRSDSLSCLWCMFDTCITFHALTTSHKP